MNNSFVFTPPTQSSSQVGHLEFKSSRNAESPALPFSKVLDRAQIPSKQPTQKPKHEPLSSGRSAEHRSARSVEAHEEHKPSAPPRSSRRKDKHDDDVAIQPGGAGMPTQIAPPNENVSASSTGNEVIESDIKVVSCSSPRTTVDEPAGELIATEVEDGEGATAESGDVNSELLRMMDGGDGAVENTIVSDLKPAESVAESVVLQASKNLQLNAEQPSATSLEGISPDEVAMTASPTDAMDMAMPQIPAATAREVALGVSREESVPVSELGIPQTAALADSDTVEAAVVNQISPEEFRRSVRVDRMVAAETHGKTHGTAVAKMTVSMNNEPKMEEVAGLTQQLLPGGAVSQFAPGINLPSEPPRSACGENIGVDALSAAARLTTGLARTDDSVSGDLLDVRDASPSARLGEVISREVRMFKRGGDDLVEVVLTPDAKTQISLKLQWRDGQVEVQARCDMGDHRLLNTQWSQLQASFAAHGVRLSHLSERAHTGFTEFFSNSGFSQQRGDERQPAQQPSAIDVMKPAVPIVKTGAARSVVRSSNRLESWA